MKVFDDPSKLAKQIRAIFKIVAPRTNVGKFSLATGILITAGILSFPANVPFNQQAFVLSACILTLGVLAEFRHRLVSDAVPRLTGWESSGYGYFRHSDKKGPRHAPRLCVVWIHGILNTGRMWIDREFVDECSKRCKWLPDHLLFTYRAFPFQNSSHQSAARHLANAIKFWQAERKHEQAQLVFITHSNGGLVLKQFVREADSDPTHPLNHCNVLGVVNLAVPHRGVSVWMKPIAATITALNYVVYWLAYAPQKVLSPFSNMALAFGVNRIFWDAGCRKGFLEELDATFDAWASKKLASMDDVVDLVALEDVIVDQRDRTVEEKGIIRTKTYRLRGGHVLSQFPEEFGIEVASMIESATFHAITSFVHRRIVQLNDMVNSQQGVSHMLGDSAPRKTGDQNEVFHFVHDAIAGSISDANESNNSVFLKGAAGVGKTRLVSWIANENIAQAGEFGRGRLVLQVLLHRMSVASIPFEPTNPNRSICHLARSWCKYASLVSHPETRLNSSVLFRWLCFFWARRPVKAVVVIDCLEAVIENAKVDTTSLVHILGEFSRQLASDGIVVGTFRAGAVDEAVLGQIPGSTCCTLDPSEEALRERFNPAFELGNKVLVDQWGNSHAEAVGVFGSPLALSAIERMASKNANWAACEVSSFGQMLELVLRGLLVSRYNSDINTVVDTRLFSAGGIDSHAFLLGAVASDMFRRGETVVDRNVAVKRLNARLGSWAEERPFGSSSISTEIQNALTAKEKDIQRGFQSVFHVLDGRSVSISHAYWNDLLMAYFFCFCVKHGLVGEIVNFGFLPRIMARAAEIGGKVVVTGDWTRRILVRSKRSEVFFGLCNLYAYFGWNPMTTFSTEGIHTACAAFADKAIPTFSRYFAITAIGARAMWQYETNRGNIQTAEAFVFKFREIMGDLTADEEECSSIRHLAGCYFRSLGGEFGELDRIAEGVHHDVAILDGLIELRGTSRISAEQSLCEVIRVLNSGRSRVASSPRGSWFERRISVLHHIHVLTRICLVHDASPSTRATLLEVFDPESHIMTTVQQEVAPYEHRHEFEVQIPSLAFVLNNARKSYLGIGNEQEIEGRQNTA